MLPTQRKNEDSISLSLNFPHRHAEHIASGLQTESEFTHSDGEISIDLVAETFSDLRAIWNSTMRGVIASEQALNAIRKEDK